MAFMSAMGDCFGCRQVFSFNPLRVPSYQGEPICRACIERVNAQRRQRGLPEWPVFPDSYEPAEASEL